MGHQTFVQHCTDRRCEYLNSYVTVQHHSFGKSCSSILETRGSSLELWWSSFNLPWSGTVSIIFLELKYLKTSLTTILIWQPLRKLTFNFYSLLLSQLPFSSSFESLFNQTNIQYSAVIWAWAFSVAQIAPKCGQSIRRVRPVFSWNSLYQ